MQMELVLFTGLPILVSLPLHRLRHTGQSYNVACAVTRYRYGCAVRCAFACSVCVLCMSGGVRFLFVARLR